MAYTNRASLALVATLLAASACGGNGTVPANPAGGNPASRFSNANANVAFPAAETPGDTTSVLKKLKKNVIIGSTIDPTNGDKGPRSVSVVKASYVFKKEQLLVCNFDNSAGAGGKGTTIDVFNPTAGSKPKTVIQSNDIEGCDGDAISAANNVYGAGLISGVDAAFTPSGKFTKKYGKPIEKPFSDVDAYTGASYAPEYIFTSDAKTGSIVSYTIGSYGFKGEKQVATGFAANNKTNWSRLGPSGLSYYANKDILYIADGVDNTVVAFVNAGELLEKNEITVLPGGKKFKYRGNVCKKNAICAKLIYSGSALHAPVAMTLLPNGNLIVANTKGGNTLVELTSAGKVLDTKVVDTSKTPGVYGLAATGTSDNNTAVFYTDRNTNTLHELEQ